MKSIALETIVGRGVTRVRWRRPRRRLWEIVRRAVAQLREWRRRSRERAQLARLDDRMLRDLGISQTDVWREVNKPFWRQ